MAVADDYFVRIQHSAKRFSSNCEYLSAENTSDGCCPPQLQERRRTVTQDLLAPDSNYNVHKCISPSSQTVLYLSWNSCAEFSHGWIWISVLIILWISGAEERPKSASSGIVHFFAKGSRWQDQSPCSSAPWGGVQKKILVCFSTC